MATKQRHQCCSILCSINVTQRMKEKEEQDTLGECNGTIVWLDDPV